MYTEEEAHLFNTIPRIHFFAIDDYTWIKKSVTNIYITNMVPTAE